VGEVRRLPRCFSEESKLVKVRESSDVVPMVESLRCKRTQTVPSVQSRTHKVNRWKVHFRVEVLPEWKAKRRSTQSLTYFHQ
jgi:hypothetical protein